MKYKKKILPLLIITFLSALFLFFSNASEGEKQFSPSDSSEYMRNYNVYALALPTKLSLAEEAVPLDRWYVKEALDRELLVNTYWQSQTLLLLKRANRFLPLIEEILKEQNVPNDLKYIAIAESGLVPTIVSPVGAVGIWQFMKGTAKDYGLEINEEIDERYHIKKATKAACAYLKEARDSLGNWTLAIAAYNAGLSGIKQQLERQDASNYYDLLLNSETGRYVYRILALKLIFKTPSKYGFKFHPTDLYPHISTKQLTVNSEIVDFAAWAKQQGVNYPILKEFNPWLRQSYLKNKQNKTYYIEIPKKGWTDFQYSSYQK